MPTTDDGDANISALHNLSRFLHTHLTPETAERVFEALRIRLSAILGANGYAMLLTRCITLSRRNFPALATVTPDATGSVTGRLAATADAYAAILTQFATLLVAFIGADLCDNLLQAVWQDIQNNSAADISREQELL